jgi:branched-chain amino acid transport system permease protein
MKKSTIAWCVGAVLLLALPLIPLFSTGYYLDFATKVLIFALFAMSLDLLVGCTGLVSLGHAAYFGIAAYVVALTAPKYGASSLLLVFGGSVLAAGLSALVIGFFAVRTKGIYFIMVTLAFAQMVYTVFHDTKLGGGSDGVYLNFKPTLQIGETILIDLANATHFYYLVAACTALCLLALRALLRSPFGQTLTGIKANEARMLSMGYNTFRYKLASFTLAGTLAGVAGFLSACQFGFVNPEMLGWHKSGDVLMMVILGGQGNFIGAAVGAAVFTIGQETLATLTPHWPLFMGLIIVCVVLFLPGGLRKIIQK